MLQVNLYMLSLLVVTCLTGSGEVDSEEEHYPINECVLMVCCSGVGRHIGYV